MTYSFTRKRNGSAGSQRRPRAKLGSPIVYQILYFRCLECREVQLDVSSNDYVRCSGKRCKRRSYYPHCSLTEDEYLIHTWGSLAEYAKYEAKASAYIKKWTAGYEQRKREGKL